jgi:hypothetical protein
MLWARYVVMPCVTGTCKPRHGHWSRLANGDVLRVSTDYASVWSLSLKCSDSHIMAFVVCVPLKPTGKEACHHPAATAQADGTSAPNACRSRAPAQFHLLQS